MSDQFTLNLDDRWHELRGMATDRRAQVYRTTADADARRRADAEDEAAMARIDTLRRDTLAREAAGDWHADWNDLVAAVFPDESAEAATADTSAATPAPDASA